MCTDIPLVVDLDGTLIKTDMLGEMSNQYLIQNPLHLISMLLWLCRGRANLKAKLIERTLDRIDVECLPYNASLLVWLCQQKSSGRLLVLATATHERMAFKVASHLNLFDEVFATTDTLNLKGQLKANVLVGRYATHGFDYVGDSAEDMLVWQHARLAYVVSSSAKLIRKTQALVKNVRILKSERIGFFRSVVRAVRLHQSVKNLLIFVPLIAAHQWYVSTVLLNIGLAFIAFCLITSSVYVLNDLADVVADRHHVLKSKRPFAAGELPIITGWALWPLLAVAGFALAYQRLPFAFLLDVLIYFLIALLYARRLRQVVILDVITLAVLYSMRLVAGASAVNVPLSFWMLTFSMFIFLSLAFIKRYSELDALSRHASLPARHGRGYKNEDLTIVAALGCSAGYLAVLVLALYIQDPNTATLYHQPRFIWLGCPLLLFWVSRAWLIAQRGEMHDDPIVFAITDATSWIVGLMFVLIFLVAAIW